MLGREQDLCDDELRPTGEESEHVGFHPDSVHLRYVETHDEDRYLDECDYESLRAAAAATFTLPGAPMIYYGQERGMTEYRGPMRWHDGDNDLTEFHRRLSFTRRETPALKEGDLSAIEYDSPSEQVVAFERNHDDGSVVVILHFGDGEAEVSIPGEVGRTDRLTGDSVELSPTSDGAVSLSVDAVVVLSQP